VFDCRIIFLGNPALTSFAILLCWQLVGVYVGLTYIYQTTRFLYTNNMDPPVSSNVTQPPNPGRVQLPPLKNLVDTLPPPNAYRSQSTTWVSPFHSIGSESSSAQSNGPPRNRLLAFPPALQTPPPRYHPAESPYTATASPSVVFSSASSGTSEPPMSDRVRPLHSAPPNGSVSDAPMRRPQDPRTNSPISSGTATSLVSNILT
jgi:hypothetical protein